MIQLIDGLGTVSLAMPASTDTFMSWIRRSDCGKPCEEGKYRFQIKGLPVFQESGWFWIGQPQDSVNQLTISHLRPDTLVKNDNSYARKEYPHFRKGIDYDLETMNVIQDTVERIGDRDYCIFKIADVDKKTNVFIRRVIAYTSVHGTVLEFHYDLLTQKKDSILSRFFDVSIDNLRTVRIKDAQ